MSLCHRLLITTALLVLCVPAHADDDATAAILRTLNAFGFRGVWAPDCFKAASKRNFRLSIDTDFYLWIALTKRGPVNPRDIRENVYEWTAIKEANITPDGLILSLESLTTDTAQTFFKIDTYQGFGDRLRLMRSEVTAASTKSQSMGYHLGVNVNQGFTIENGQISVPEPMLERCNE